MDRSFRFLIAGIVILLSGQSYARDKDQHPVFIAPGFQFNQVDTVCVMPLTVAGIDKPATGLDVLRPALMLMVQEKGYRLLEPNCSRDTDSSTAQRVKPHWILTVSLNSFLVPAAAQNTAMGSVLTASLFDTQSAKEVWRDTAKTRWGGRFASNLLGNSPIGAVEGDLGNVLAKFEKQTKPYPPSQATTWAPMSMSARLYKLPASFSGCDGLLRFDSGTLSFEPSSNGKRDEKCSDFRFSVQGAKIDGRLLVIPGKGKFCFPSGISQAEMDRVTYLELTVRSAE